MSPEPNHQKEMLEKARYNSITLEAPSANGTKAPKLNKILATIIVGDKLVVCDLPSTSRNAQMVLDITEKLRIKMANLEEIENEINIYCRSVQLILSARATASNLETGDIASTA